MRHQTVKSIDSTQATEDAIYFSLLLAHVKERLRTLTPGINCTFEQYSKLTKEKISLTLIVNKASLNSRGFSFVEEADTTYTINNVVLKLGGTYRQRVRA